MSLPSSYISTIFLIVKFSIFATFSLLFETTWKQLQMHVGFIILFFICVGIDSKKHNRKRQKQILP